MSIEYLDYGFLFDAPVWKKQEFLIFSMFVAGKPADVTHKKTQEFLALPPVTSPFGVIEWYIQSGKLRDRLKKAKVGKYDLYEKGLTELIESDIDAENTTLEELQQITGIGRKTSRFFLLYTDSEFQGIPLDTHKMSFLRDIGFNAPKNTPSSKNQYRKWEKVLLDLADYLDFDSIPHFDYTVWRNYNGGGRRELARSIREDIGKFVFEYKHHDKFQPFKGFDLIDEVLED